MSMPGTAISSGIGCSAISASPFATNVPAYPFGPPAASLAFGFSISVMPSLSNSRPRKTPLAPPLAASV